MLTRAQGGVTLGPEQSEPGADFNPLGSVTVQTRPTSHNLQFSNTGATMPEHNKG
jgi:hypothetical protein